MNSSFLSEWVLPHFPFTSQKSESQTEESKKSTLIKTAETNQKPNPQNQINLFLPSQIQSQYAFWAIHPHLATTPCLQILKLVQGLEFTERNKPRKSLTACGWRAAPGRALPRKGSGREGAVPWVPDPASFTRFPPGAGLVWGPESPKRGRNRAFLTCQHPVGGSHAWASASRGPEPGRRAAVAGAVLPPARPAELRCRWSSALCTARPPRSRVRHFLFVIQSLRCFFALRRI